MQIVIDIPEEWYRWAKFKNIDNGSMVSKAILDAIGNGTPLPKGHGRLIDADELKTLSYEVLVDTDNPNRADGLSACNGIVEDDIDYAPTIIEADKAESEDKYGKI